MNKNNKYILNMGLAFDEDRVLKKMSDLAKDGWILNEMTLFRYKLEKSEACEIIYSMDYKELKQDKEEYFEIFNNSGWSHMCSYGPYHFFSAEKGTIPIYTDKKNYLEKYKKSRNIYLKTLVLSVLSLVIVSLLKAIVYKHLSSRVFDFILFIVGILSIGVAVPCFMVTVAYIFRFKINTNSKDGEYKL